ncbi:MAG: TRAP transporter large permease [Desulfobacterales bacterium]|nr:TRAP transporter large permease [Desulfobacterales bacterium]
MSPAMIGIIGLMAFFALLVVRMPVAMAMLVTGFVGIAAINGLPAAYATLSAESFEISSYLELSVVPLFVFMGNLAGLSGMSADLYNAAYAWAGHRRGGLAAATIIGCAGFAALSGSSFASAVTMGRVALPEMKRYKYADSLAAGSVAAGGTLGILIPPSSGFVIYAILTEQSIAKLFIAGVFPGILLTILFLATISIATRIRPELGPAGPRVSLGEKLATLRRAGTIVLIVLVTIGGIYGGVMTPVEASGVGAFLTLMVALVRRSLHMESFKIVILQTLRTTALTFMILIGAHVFIPFMALSRIPDNLVTYLTHLDFGPAGILMIVLATYIILGMFLEGIAMLVLTLPVVFPVMLELGYSPIWFGVMVVIVLEMGLISPPVGVNVFVVKGVAPDVSLNTIFRGIWPFWLAMLVCLLILVAFPQIALFLPDRMF